MRTGGVPRDRRSLVAWHAPWLMRPWQSGKADCGGRPLAAAIGDGLNSLIVSRPGGRVKGLQTVRGAGGRARRRGGSVAFAPDRDLLRFAERLRSTCPKIVPRRRLSPPRSIPREGDHPMRESSEK